MRIPRATIWKSTRNRISNWPASPGRQNGEAVKPLFPTSVVGSLPRPAFVLDLINERPPLARAEYEQRMQAAVRYAVAMQEQSGLDVLTDGEWWRKSYIGVIAELANGFELGTLPDGRPFTLVVDKLSPKAPGFI